MADLYPLYDGSDPFETLRNLAEKEDAHDEEQVRRPVAAEGLPCLLHCTDTI